MTTSDIWPQDVAIAIGSYHFTPEKIIAFAEKFDPQYFHLDAEKARQSVLGGLCASGWHVCSVWMKLNVAFITAKSRELAEEGLPPPRMGPAMGVRDLKWKAPVFAGDTITFTNTLLRQSQIPHRPDRLLMEVQGEGVNQNGKSVISFRPQVIRFA